jgi:hypothetical protein
MSNQWKLVPVEPTETMVINGFESEPDECFTDEEVLEQYRAMSGCQQAAFRAKLCWAAMLSAAPMPPQPIYSKASDRELFELIISKRGWSTEKVDGFYSEPYAHYAWSICLEFAQARAKAGEAGHE